ncbi:hypothetical protein Tsubulata_011539 [Turnera subulata]|uniref:C2H2-type domain-containing protein n=1 Tax=Turnera subulata TaxID=218843 RepID=A0A9Q0GMI2_9ROSI|nr:hypothetical protein Tsubulata_011539 [Turnera subulata]
MEANQKKNFVCKFCNKRYPCGKSLGGHIRIHLNGSSTDADHGEAKQQQQLKMSKSFAGGDHGSNSVVVDAKRIPGGPEAGGGGQSGYVLRENPKKTSRFTIDSFNNNPSLPEKVCKECGKGFQSLKALCGHMACHSKNNNNNNNLLEDHSGTSEKLIKEQLLMDSTSDTDTSSPSKRRRSKRMRYKTTVGVYSSSSLSPPNGSLLSSASDIENEQEEVALCLMMLSKDSGFKGCFSSAADNSSDNNSVVLETKSSSSPTRLRISLNNCVDLEFNGDELVGVKKKAKQQGKMIISADDNDHSENSDSGYFSTAPQILESNSCANYGFNSNDAFIKDKAEFGSSYGEDLNNESAKRISRFRRIRTVAAGKNLVEEEDGYDHEDNRALTKSDFKKLGKKKTEFAGANSNTTTTAADSRSNVFTHKGHTSSHKKDNWGSDSIYESGENSMDTDYVPTPLPSSSNKIVRFTSGKAPTAQNSSGNGQKKAVSRKGKVHECPFCSKVFRSGQALGGHKRSHFVGGGEDRTLVIKQEVPQIPMRRLIDLNLPVAVEEEADGFLAW